MSTEAFGKNLAKKLGEKNLKKVRSARVGIAGAGGLGSNCALHLVRVGFENLTIVDFDRVEEANLDRQFYFLDQVGMDKVEALKINLLRINPGLNLKIIKKKIDKDNIKDIFADSDVIAECLDTAACKKMLLEELLLMGKFVVAVSGLGGIGSSDDIKIHKIRDKLIIIGDLASDICSKPALSPRVNVASAKQADYILDHVLKNK
ncbi:MAG: sulfur carrier protein ThiS adenylyltransferase ThiF [Candidatus Omnitrophota bacterium]|jgi:sulfur carrier protein ThiS adenylyltransferase